MTKTKNIYLVPVRKKDRREIVSDARVHNGSLKNTIDFGLPQGTPILAAYESVVIYVKEDLKTNIKASKI